MATMLLLRLVEQIDPAINPYSQLGIIGLVLGTLVLVVRWMMSRMDRTIDANSKAIDGFMALVKVQSDHNITQTAQMADLVKSVTALIYRLDRRDVT